MIFLLPCIHKKKIFGVYTITINCKDNTKMKKKIIIFNSQMTEYPLETSGPRSHVLARVDIETLSCRSD